MALTDEQKRRIDAYMRKCGSRGTIARFPYDAICRSSRATQGDVSKYLKDNYEPVLKPNGKKLRRGRAIVYAVPTLPVQQTLNLDVEMPKLKDQ